MIPDETEQLFSTAGKASLADASFLKTTGAKIGEVTPFYVFYAFWLKGFMGGESISFLTLTPYN